MTRIGAIKEMKDDDLMALLPSELSDSAFRELFDRYYAPLVTFASRILSQTDEPYDLATDVVQNLFVSIYEKRASTILTSSARSFFFTSTRNACLNVLKHQKVMRQYEADAVASDSELASGTDDADFLIEQSEADAKIAKALGQLPEQCRRIFVMSRMDGLSNQQIADQLEISKRTVETQISNALKTLRKILITVLALSDLLFHLYEIH